MAKKKKKDKGLLYNIDGFLDDQYASIYDEVLTYQEELMIAEKKAKKKAKKKMKNKEFYPYEYEIKARRKVIKEMEDNNFFERIDSCINDLKPICIIIARLVAALILAILSVDAVRGYIKPDTLEKMNTVYQIAMSF